MKNKNKKLKTLEETQQLRNNLSGLLGNEKNNETKGNNVLIQVRDNNHLLMQIKCLLEVCVLALDGDGIMMSPANKNFSKEDSIAQLLEMVLNMLPYSQMYFMDELDDIFLKITEQQ